MPYRLLGTSADYIAARGQAYPSGYGQHPHPYPNAYPQHHLNVHARGPPQAGADPPQPVPAFIPQPGYHAPYYVYSGPTLPYGMPPHYQFFLQPQVPRRQRLTQACDYCHKKKVKCDGDKLRSGGNARCSMCIKNDIKCVWRERKKRGPKPRPLAQGNPQATPAPAQPDTQGSASGSTQQQQQNVPAAPVHEGIVSSAGSSSAAEITSRQYFASLSPTAATSAPKQAFATNIASSSTASPLNVTAAVSPAMVAAGRKQALQSEQSAYHPEFIRADSAGLGTAGSEFSVGDNMSVGTSDLGASDIVPPPIGSLLDDFYSAKVDPEVRETVIAYFDYFYSFCPVLHPSTFIRRVISKDVSPLLLDALKSITSRFITKTTGRQIDADVFATRVKSQIVMVLEDPSVDVVCALMVVAMYESCCGRFDSYNTLICMVSSMLIRLGWHKLDMYKRQGSTTWEEWVDLESKRRIFWLMYQSDNYLSLLGGRPAILAENIVFNRASCSDSEWDELGGMLTKGMLSRASSAAPGAANDDDSNYIDNSDTDSSDIEDSAEQGERQSYRRWTPVAGASPGAERSAGAGAGAGVAMGRQPSPLAAGPSSQVAARESKSPAAATQRQGTRAIAQGATSQSFTEMNTLVTLNARISTFLRQAKSPWYNPQMIEERSGPFPAIDYFEHVPSAKGNLVIPVVYEKTLLSEYPLFVRYATELANWQSNVVPAETLRDPMDSRASRGISYFGQGDYHVFMLRVRYFNIKCYSFTAMTILHSSNRPSFFTEFEEPLELFQVTGNGASELPPGIANLQQLELRKILNKVFGQSWSQGLVANDIEACSWRTCVGCAHELSDHVRRNDDIPVEYYDLIIPFVVFVTLTVLLRQFNKCKEAIDANDTSEMTIAELQSEQERSLRDIKHQWALLRELGSVWSVDGMTALLGIMGVDEVAEATKQLSSIAL
ncbi:hypothetical protein GQ54DRAFT_309854 [Martensiomyces pterosporus]|nr:hypothetical protein GQ54DRAFT_309854 [Martensiomyces pterosporus]